MTRNDITYQDKLNELMLDVSHPNNSGFAFVLLEGDSDIRLFRKLFDTTNCKVESIPGGNGKLQECVNTLCPVYSLVFAIRDADFLHLEATPYESDSVFLTDFHDIEISMISEDSVFSALVFEFTDINEAEHSLLKANILKTIEDLAYMKWLNYLENLELKFEAGFQDLISFVDYKIDIEQYITRIFAKSPNKKIDDAATLINKMNDLKALSPNLLHLCNGHDFIKTFAKFVREKQPNQNVNDIFISSLFRTCYTPEHFRSSKLYLTINKWIELNNCASLC